jgi:hypothetical protein
MAKMTKTLLKERTKFWNNWFKRCKTDPNFMGTCSIQNLIYNRDQEVLDSVAPQHGFYIYARLGRGDSGNKGYKLK